MKIDIWEIIFWSLLSYIFIFAILKGMGIIKTPEIIEISPLIATGILIAYIRLFVKKEIITLFETESKKLENRFESLESRLMNGFENLESRLMNRFENLESKLMNRFESLENEFTNKFGELEVKLTTKIDSLEVKSITKIDSKVKELSDVKDVLLQTNSKAETLIELMKAKLSS